MVKVILLTTSTCPYCPLAEEVWEDLRKRYEFEFEVVDAMTPKGKELVTKYNIMAVPTSIVSYGDKKEDVIKGVPNPKEIAEKLTKK